MNEELMQGTLAGFAELPADTFAEGPQSGADDGNGEPISANGRIGPFNGQPVQGFSGVQFAPEGKGAFWFLSDNGFGAQSNSKDYLLRLYQVDPSFTGEIENGDGSIEVQSFVQLSDPNNLIPFDIINEDTEDRLVTGGDFDIESFALDSNGDIWVGEEFGPYILHFNLDGELLEAPIATPNETNFNTLNGQDPLVIGHRGASGVLPEHTLEAYATAIAQGADFIEPDLVSTKDGVLIARHEPILDDTTNVTEVFGEDRKSTKILDGEEVTAYFAEDFTLEEIKQLRAVQSRDFRSQNFNGAFEIPTFQEVIELVLETEAETGKQVGIYPETKHPTFFDEQGLSLEEPLIKTLQETGFTDPNRIFIQSFEFQNLNDLAAIYGQEFLDAVEDGLSEETTYRDLYSAEMLQIISDKYAEGAGPWKNNILLRESLDEPVDGDGDGEAEITTQLTGEITSFVDDAHAAGLQVHPYTHRNEERFLTLNPDGTPQTPESEIEQLVAIGVDGFFTDFPNTGAAVVGSLAGEFVQSPQNPDLGDGIPNLSSSRGYEGMAFSPDRMTLYPLLEGTVNGDPENSLRIYEFDVASSSFTGLLGYYPTTDGNPIGDFTPINDSEFLVIERDGGEGAEAEFKKVFKINIDNIDANGFVEKTEIVDLLNIADPDDLNDDGNTTYDMPFVTIEDVVVIDEDTILVANDNNYPFSMGREDDIDNNEVVLIDLEEPLDLDPRLGQEPMTTPESTTAKNVIIMIGDGMGWNIARAAAIQQQINQGAEGDTLADFYTEGVGTGLPFQNLDGYAIATTSGTYIDGSKSNSALKGDTLNRETGIALVRDGFKPENLPGEDADGEFDPAQVIGFFPELREGSEAPILGEFDPNFDERPLFAENEEGELVQVGGFLNAYDTTKGRPVPWLEDTDPDYPKNLFPDSANTATTLYSGVKSYNAAIGVDIYEEDIETIGETARELGKSFGVVSSVPFSHATPGSAVGHVSHRNKLTETERVENFEVVLDENGVPLHEEHGDGSHEGEPVFELDEDGNPIPIEDDNILFQILNETQPEVIIGGGHPDGRGDERYMDLGTLEQLRNDETVYTFTERGENAAEVLATTASTIDVNEEEKLFGLYGARGQGGNLPWSTANGDYSNTGLSSRLDAERPLEEGETDEEFIASEIDANPTLAQMTSAALDVLEDDEDGFWVSIEGGDIDWAAHDNNLDNMIGATLDFADAVEEVQDWIADNGGYEENLLVVTADHDHYFTLNDNFPQLLREVGAEGLTTQLDENGNVLATDVDSEGVPLVDDEGNPFIQKVDNLDPEASGHYWGSDPEVKVGWSHHTTIPVPVYYQGAGSEYLDNAVGTGFEQYGFDVPGVDGLIDQVHIANAQFAAFGTEQGANRDFLNLLDGEDLNLDISAEVNAGFINIGGFYQAIDTEGTVLNPESGEEVAVGEKGYEAAALANSVAEVGDGETTTVDLEGGFVYVPYLLADGVQFLTAFADANADGIDHVQSVDENSFGFEDLLGGGDSDFDDYVISFETT